MPEVHFSAEEVSAADAYIDALLRDPNTVAPTSLSPDLAAFIRTLVEAEQVTVAHDVQARVWRKAYLSTQVHRLQQPSLANSPQGSVMTTTPIPFTPRRVNLTNNVTLFAAAAAVIVLVAAMVTYSTLNKPPQSTAFGNGGQVSSPTLIPTGTATFTPTPSAASIDPMLGTATAILAGVTETSATLQTANALPPSGIIAASPSPTHTATLGNANSSIDPLFATATKIIESVTATAQAAIQNGNGDSVIATLMPSRVPLDPTAGLATPVPVIAAPEIPPEAYEKALRVSLNNMTVGGISAEQPYMIYEFEAPQDGMMDIFGVTADFPISLTYQYIDSTGGGGGGGGGGGDTLPLSAEIVVFVKKGSLVRIAVTTQNATQYGQFNLGFYFDQGTILSDLSQPIKGQIEPGGTHFRYYLFTGKVGSRLDLTASQMDNPDLDLTMMLMEVPTTMGGSAVPVNADFTNCTSVIAPVFCSDDNSGKRSDPELSNVLIRSNTLYAILIRAVPMGSAAGWFNLDITEHAPLSIDQSAQSISLDSRHRRNVVVFTGKAAQAYTLSTELTLTMATGRLIAQITVMQNGYVLGTGAAGPTNSTLQIVPIADGPVVVIAEYTDITQPYVIPATITFSLIPQQ